jgi:hypothetical protein
MINFNKKEQCRWNSWLSDNERKVNTDGLMRKKKEKERKEKKSLPVLVLKDAFPF